MVYNHSQSEYSWRDAEITEKQLLHTPVGINNTHTHTENSVIDCSLVHSLPLIANNCSVVFSKLSIILLSSDQCQQV